MIRLLVTGSRQWTDYAEVCRVMDEVLSRFGAVTVVQGGARGADRMAERWALSRRNQGRAVTVETWPPDWERCTGPRCTPRHRKQQVGGGWYCPTAGHHRNALMVESGPELCIAFRVPARSRGTDQCVATARKAGIPVAVYEPRSNVEEVA